MSIPLFLSMKWRLLLRQCFHRIHITHYARAWLSLKRLTLHIVDFVNHQSEVPVVFAIKNQGQPRQMRDGGFIFFNA
jgi:hypothetical protein